MSDAEIERGVLRGMQGPAGKGYIEKSKAFWEVKSAENRAAGAGMELKFHQNLLAATKISVSEDDVWRKSVLEWMFTLVGGFLVQDQSWESLRNTLQRNGEMREW
ncbi:hypothetical protein QQ045_014690 [Rhodiola kirilowii]